MGDYGRPGTQRIREDSALTYYVVLLDGVPVDVTTYWARAVKSKEELTVPGKDAIILPCVPREDDFESEELTDLDGIKSDEHCQCEECEFVRSDM